MELTLEQVNGDQQAFEFVVKHLLKQGKCSYGLILGRSDAIRPHCSCKYRGPDNTTCAVGCLIPERFYKPDWEGFSVHELLNEHDDFLLYFFKKNISHKLLARLQQIHDGAGTAKGANFKIYILLAAERLAKEMKLEIPSWFREVKEKEAKDQLDDMSSDRPIDHEILLSDLDLMIGDIVTITHEGFDNSLFRIVSYNANGCDETSSVKKRGVSATKRPYIRVEQVVCLGGKVCYAVRFAAKSKPLVRLEPNVAADNSIKKIDLIAILMIREQVERIVRNIAGV